MIKYNTTTFDEYLTAVKKDDLHPYLASTYAILTQTPPYSNIILYGPSGIGKYSQALKYVVQCSNMPKLKDKKLAVTYNKQEFLFKMSDYHYEINMELLGCNSKSLWHEIFTQLVDIITTPRYLLNRDHQAQTFIICKNFHMIHNELLDVFYSYMQMYANKICYILITDHVSFIPDNILNTCKLISLKRPSKSVYAKLYGNMDITTSTSTITNIKYLATPDTYELNTLHYNICNNIITLLTPANNKVDFGLLRNYIYEILTYQLDVYECIWYILNKLQKNDAQTTHIIKILYIFFKQFNNNYRPIYHLEWFLLSIVNVHSYAIPIPTPTPTPAQIE